MKQYNINELLEKKKELEEQIQEKASEIDIQELTYQVTKVTDHTNDDRETQYIPRDKQTIDKFTNELYGLIDELVKVKTAIQKFNADKLLGKLQERESMRLKHNILKTIVTLLPKDKKHQRQVTRQNKEGVALETTESTVEPMFDKKDVEKRMNEFAAQERKINTSIQKENLNAKIEV